MMKAAQQGSTPNSVPSSISDRGFGGGGGTPHTPGMPGSPQPPGGMLGGNGSSSGSQPSPSGGYMQSHGGHQSPTTPSSTPVGDMSPQPHGMSGSPPVASWDIKPNIGQSTHHHPNSYMPQYGWYQPDANQPLLTVWPTV